MTTQTSAKTALWKQPAFVAAVAAAILALALAFVLYRQQAGLQQELAMRLAAGDSANQESRSFAKQNQEDIQGLIARIGVLEARLNDAQGQQAALETLYQELASGRDARVLAEIEQSLVIAAQQLQLAGNVEAALIALQSADARLSRSNVAHFSQLRRLVTRDIERLRALPQADITGMALRLEAVAASIDSLPLAYAQRPVKTAAPAETAATGWRDLAGDVWQEIRGLVRIERMDQDAPALLAPSQSLFLRENLRLRLVNARLSLLQRDAKSFRSDVQLATKWLKLYFDMRAPGVVSAHDTLQKMSAAELALGLPNLDETLAAARNLKLPGEKR